MTELANVREFTVKIKPDSPGSYYINFIMVPTSGPDGWTVRCPGVADFSACNPAEARRIIREVMEGGGE